jgi:hypothetical protein
MLVSSTSKAFSSEVDTGSREENALNKELEPAFRFNRNGKKLRYGALRRRDRSRIHGSLSMGK